MTILRIGFFTAFAMLIASPLFAFCGFYVGGADSKLYNDATQVAVMRSGETTVLSMQNNYEGPAADFAMVVPVPVVLQKENVKTLPKTLFDKLDKLSAPRLVEYWEKDPCAPDPPRKKYKKSMRKGGVVAEMADEEGGAPLVKVEAQFEVGEYDIVILSAKDATALEVWLEDNKYKIPGGAAPYFKPYVESGSYFFVAKVNIKRAKYENGKAVLSPLRFHYPDKKLTIPIRLGLINSKGEQDLIAYVLADGQRFEAANYPAITIPTNLEVGPKTKENFGGFYETLFSSVVEANPKAVVTEYSWASGSCDPCPAGSSAALTADDLATLGTDVITGMSQWNVILTRLHARYTKEQVGEDLVLKKADAIVGGRQFDDSNEAKPDSRNNFQGRYIIRNEWTGEVKCDIPRRGRWGGPWDPSVKQQTASAPSQNTVGKKVKGAGKLSDFVKEAVPGLADKIEKTAPDPDITPKENPKEKEVPGLVAPENAPTKSGCATTHAETSWLFLLLGLLGFARRRRR